MKRKVFGKRLLAMAVSAIMLLGCAGAASAYTLTKEEKEALNIKSSRYHFAADDKDDDDDDDYGSVSPIKLKATSTKVQTMVRRLHAQHSNVKLHLLFGVSGVDEDDGTRVILIDDEVSTGSQLSLYQYNTSTGLWKQLYGLQRYPGYMKFRLKSNDPIAITLPKVEVRKVSISPKTSKGYYNIRVGKSKTLTAKITPSYADNKEVVWTSSNKKVATVKDLGNGKCKVTIKKTAQLQQSSTIKVTSKDNKKVYAKVKVYVTHA